MENVKNSREKAGFWSFHVRNTRWFSDPFVDKRLFFRQIMSAFVVFVMLTYRGAGAVDLR